MGVRKPPEILLPILLSIAIVLFLRGFLGQAATDPLSPTLGIESAQPEDAVRSDVRVQAFLQAFGPLFDSVTYSADDAVFSLGEGAIHFQDGRMLGTDRLGDREQFESIFYRYPLEWMTEVPQLTEEPAYSRDFLDLLFGQTEVENRSNSRSVIFLDHRMFVNSLLVEPLLAVEREIRATALADQAVARWMEELDITYSFIRRDIAGTQTRSYHAYGLAVDLVPLSYEGKHMYWRWSRVHNREGWSRIPLSRRWTPPQSVVEAFERHGFVWGGKWSRFDNIHFEYRPEIILYNRMEDESGALPG
jgi:hypothetical protein